MICIQIFLLCLLPIHLFSQITPDLLQSTTTKVDFECTHHCGLWGSESIRLLEWEFVQCLYDAHAMSNYIAQNYLKRQKLSRFKYKDFIPKETQFQFTRPESFQSAWYLKALEDDTDFIELPETIPNYFDCPDGECSVWRIRHVSDHNGNHLGKYFIRSSFIERFDDYDDEYPNLDAPQFDFQGSVVYKFGNYIDFSNLCEALEDDILKERNAETCRKYSKSPVFENEIIEKHANVFCSIQELKKHHINLFEKCAHEHDAPSAFYNLAIDKWVQGQYWDGLEHLRSLIDRVDVKNLEKYLASEIYQSKGNSEVEVALFDDAILSLTKAIELNPENQVAYFERSIAYFENGEFDLSLKDYLQQIHTQTSLPEYYELVEFGLGLTHGGAKGLNESLTEFLPSICSSIRGVGNLLWTTINQPIAASRQFAASTIEFCKYLQKCDPAELIQILVPEMYELVTQWDSLNYKQRGELTGYVLGKYGTDVLLPVAILKGTVCVKAYQEIRKTEKLCTLEMLAQSTKSKMALTEASSRWQTQRQAYFAKVQIEIDKQAKHIPGTKNYVEGRSIFTHPCPQKLLSQHAGKGQKAQGIISEPGYRERVDFGEVIGYFVKDEMQIPTTVGMIHYSKKGAHIVPAQPK
jgi:tetratricopeptide (TPR) repeat protein